MDSVGHLAGTCQIVPTNRMVDAHSDTPGGGEMNREELIEHYQIALFNLEHNLKQELNPHNQSRYKAEITVVTSTLEALRNPWVKTADRLPDAEQIARNDKIFLLCKQHGGAYEAYTHWADGLASHPEKFEFDYWMPVPPLTEVEE